VSTAVGQVLADTGGKAALIAKALWAVKSDIWFGAIETGFRFTAEDLINAIGTPSTAKDNNAVGAKIRSWSQSKKIVCVGYKKSERSISHARVITIWEKL